MKYIIDLYSGFECVESGKYFKFGMTSEEVSELLGEKIPSRINGAEYYTDFSVDYDKDNLVSAYEFFSHSKLYIRDENYPQLCGKNLFEMKHKELKKIIKQYDPHSIDDAGVQSLKLGIGTYYESTEYPVSEGIIIFKQGYYDKL